MAQPVIQHSFHAGEWAPALNARVDLQKYHSAAALLRNFFVDYRGGASTRAGTKYILQAFKSATAVRLIPFVASFSVNYVLEFGDFYIRFYNNGAAVLESTFAITGATQANPAVLTVVGNNYVNGDWIFVTGVVGMTQLNGRYFQVTVVGNAVTLLDLNGVNINSTGFGAYSSGGTTARVYTLPSPYAAGDLALLKFSQNVSSMILTHGSYVPYVLTLVSANNWTILPIVFGTSITAPIGMGIATTGAGAANFSYVVTAVDVNGQESTRSAIVSSTIDNVASRTLTVSWSAVSGAASYNVYRTDSSIAGVMPSGAAFGYIGFTTSLSFPDTFQANYLPFTAADFSITPPLVRNPFITGAGVASATVTAAGAYTTVPTITFGAAPSGGTTATGTAFLWVTAAAVSAGGSGYFVGNLISLGNGVVVRVIGTTGTTITSVSFVGPGANRGQISSGTTPTNPVAQVSATQGTGSGGPGTGATITLTWGVGGIVITYAGTAYITAPAITFSAGAAAATAVLGSSSSNNPSVSTFFNQRLTFAATLTGPQSFYMSQPGNYYNFNVSSPIQADDAITASIVSGQLNTIKSMIPMQSGLILLSSRAAWLVNGGQGNVGVTPINVTAQSHAYNGATDVPPIVATFDILFVQAKGSIVRDLSFNFYTQVYTGTDISVLSSHLFYGHQITEWAFAEEPFKTVWCVREDGILLSLTFVKEQEVIGWAHSDTKGSFKSVATVTESVTALNSNVSVDAVYVVVQRIINGFTVQYVERMAERLFPYGDESAWTVDAALTSTRTFPAATLTASQSAVGTGVTFTASAAVFTAPMVGNVIRMGGGIATITGFTSTTVVTGTITQAITAVTPDDPLNTPLPSLVGFWSQWIPATTFSGLDHLEGQSVTGLADGAVIPPTTVVGGAITLASPATKVTIGLAYTAQLQTLRLDTGEPTIQGKRKQITGFTVRCQETLGLSAGRTFSTLVSMKDLVVGNVGTMSNQVVTDLVSDDARTILDPIWDVLGQCCIQQSKPFPATVLGVIPEIVVGDTQK